MRRNVRRTLVAMLLVLPVLLNQPLAAPAAGSGRVAAATHAPRQVSKSPYTATAPTAGALYTDGPDGRYLLGGTWLFRPDAVDVGVSRHYQSSASTAGWSPATVPNAWNATDQSDASMNGSIGWYRRDFRLPDASSNLAWIVRFESVNFHAEVWLNGHPLGTNTGAYLAFEFPLAHLNLTGVNRLVIRVEDRLVNNPVAPQPPYGWWNYGGLLGEVYLRKVDRVDFAQVQVRPTIACPRCRADISDRATIHNYSAVPQVVHVTGVYGPLRLDLGRQTVAAGQDAIVSATGSFARPRLWSPSHPNLYTARLIATAVAAGRSGANQSPTRAAGYTVLSGVRSIRVDASGQLVLNGTAIRFRGVAIHEDNPLRGGAIDNADRAQIIALTHDVGATLIRAHHPLHPELEELADRTGILLWSEIPIYQLSENELGRSTYTHYGRAQLQSNILTNQNHPAVAIWSIANELPTTPGPNQIAYIDSQAALAKQLDPTRPVAQAVAVNPTAGCQAQAYAPLDILGLNDYFGWYTGAQGSIADRDALSGDLDTQHACYRHKVLAITEFGAEANRPGPVEEKGTYAFQTDFVKFHLGVYLSKPWLAGAVYFTLQEFRVAPGWVGGDPLPDSPIHQKGLISFTGFKKPAYYVVRQIFRATAQHDTRDGAGG
ncbi:MAG TPA: glycoside hydrolase family 2 TIM barrel-domain containing protein [Solirubrobacteraceae bacterium]|nr:glycoside hydrolase family 2 TIM barrel-domain containing protein [Solirubrobacteraceae bacterium]